MLLSSGSTTFVHKRFVKAEHRLALTDGSLSRVRAWRFRKFAGSVKDTNLSLGALNDKSIETVGQKE